MRRPQLFATEFGYFNRRLLDLPALGGHAGRRRPRGRTGAANCTAANYQAVPFDVGMLENDTGAVNGIRDDDFHFGMRRECQSIFTGTTTPTEDRQERKAYCAVHRWSRPKGYPFRTVSGC